MPACEHVPAPFVAARADACEECDSRFNLRVCATCGHVGCCDSQAGHARTHYEETGHPVMQSAPAGQGFTWCYTHDAYLDLDHPEVQATDR